MWSLALIYLSHIVSHFQSQYFDLCHGTPFSSSTYHIYFQIQVFVLYLTCFLFSFSLYPSQVYSDFTYPIYEDLLSKNTGKLICIQICYWS